MPNNRPPLPRNYYYYLLLLLFAGIVFVGYAFLFPAQEVSFELRQARVDRFLHSATVDTLVSDTPVAAVDTTPDPPTTYHWDLDPESGQMILLFGDSMNEYLRLRLNDYCFKNGYSMHCVIWYGATTKQYGSTDTIAHFIRKYKPTYVLLNFGANELFVRDIRDKRQGYVEHILAQVANLPYVWVGPPNWKEDTGINDLILANTGRGRYFESRRLTLDRYSDGAHPTRAAASDWMDSIALFLSTQARTPLRMDPPDTALSRVPHTTVIAMEK